MANSSKNELYFFFFLQEIYCFEILLRKYDILHAKNQSKANIEQADFCIRSSIKFSRANTSVALKAD